MGWSVVFGALHPAWQTGMDLETWVDSDHLLISPLGRPDTPSPLDGMLRSQGLERRVRLHMGYLSAAAGTLERTAYVTSLPTPCAHQIAQHHRLRVAPHPFDAHMPRLTLRITWHQMHHTDPGHVWLRGLAAAVIAEQIT